MDVNEDAEILSRLGILHSNEESPNKHTSLKLGSGFVDVNINGEIDSDSENDDIFDRNTLLSVSSRQPNVRTDSRRTMDNPMCRFFIIALCFFAAGVSLHSSPDVLLITKKVVSAIVVAHVGGQMIGVAFARLWIPRFNAILLLFMNIVLLTIITCTLLYSRIDSYHMHILALVQGFCVSNILYASISLWFIWWRSSKRKVIFFIAIFLLGALFSLITRINHVNINSSSVTVSHHLHKRNIDGLDESNTFGNSSLSFLEETTPKPKKPEMATGVKKVETKTKENENRRKEIVADFTTKLESNETVEMSTVPLTSSSTTTTITTTTITTTTPTPTTQMSTTTVPPTTPIKPKRPGFAVGAGGDILKGAVDKLSPLIPQLLLSVDQSTEIVILTTLSLCLSVFVLSFVCCCLSINVVADSRVAKLADHSCPGLTAGCRGRLVIVHVLASFLAATITLAANRAESDDSSALTITTSASSFLIALLSIVLGTRACGFAYGWSLLLLTFGGVVILVFDIESSLGYFLAGGPATMMNTIIFLQVESKVSARPQLNMEILCYSVVFGKACLHFPDYYFGPVSLSALSMIVFGTTLLMFIAYFLSNRTVYKAARLKEIYEYTEENVNEHRHLTFRGNSAYTTLIEPSISSDEDSV